MTIPGVRLTPLRTFFASFAALFLFAEAAQAQTITIPTEVSLPRVKADGSPANKRLISLEPEGVSLQDCVDDLRIRFTLILAGFEPQATLQVWAGNLGVDCKAQTARAGATQQCWKLGPDINLQQQVDTIIPVREIMSGVRDPLKPNAEQSVCGTIDLSTVTVQFLYFKPAAQTTPAAHKDVNIKIDTIGPKPPSGLKILPGNTRLQVQWDNISGDGGVTALTGVKVYCDTASAVTTSGEASVEDAGFECIDVPIDGAADDASDDAALFTDGGCTNVTKTVTPESSTKDCASSNFVDSSGNPVLPTAEFNSKYECGSITGNTGTSVRAEAIAGNPLANGTRYAVAVAATDAFGNVGPLSSVICETPAETTDFWEAYRNAGGEAGGGFCTTSGPGLPTGTLTVLGVAGLIAGSLVRRRGRGGKGR